MSTSLCGLGYVDHLRLYFFSA